MLRRVLAVFDRFAAARLDRRRPGLPIRDEAGAGLGRVEAVALEGRRLVVRGQARGEALTLTRGPDAAGAALDPGREAPFELALPLPEGPAPLRLRLAHGGGEVALDLPRPSLLLARLALWPSFLVAASRALPDALRWHRTRDPAFRARVRRALALDLAPEGLPADAGMLAPPPDHLPPPPRPFTIVLPVFDAFDDLRDCLARLEAHADLPWRLLLVEDASGDARVRPWLRGWAAGRGHVELLENEANLGFVGSVNRGLARAAQIDGEAPVVLLNSDAMVPRAWASRLLAPLGDPTVASVTPMSNDSEVTSVPVVCRRASLRPGEADRIDGEAQGLHPLAATAAMPTGVGFCMALSPRFLRAVPRLDPAFGRGYGEEVDWCQRARAAGGRHLGTGALFVEHRGGGSFGSDAKRELLARHNRIISGRYPAYDAEVRAFVERDPLATPRLLLALAWADARAEGLGGEDRLVPVILAHAIGGGAELALGRRVARDLARGLPSVVIRVGLQARWRVEVHGGEGAPVAARTDSEAVLRRLLRPLRRRRVLYVTGVSDPDPAAIPALLLGLADEAEEAEVELELHDYFPVSPSYTLLDAQGRFRGPVVAGGEAARDPAHRARRPDGASLALEDWQAAWRPLLGRARVTAFSRASLDLLLAAYPEAAARARVLPHEPLVAVSPVPRPPGPRVLGVLGNIAPHKGAALLQGIARALPSGGVARLVLLGDMDPAFALPRSARSARVHGSYEPGDIAGLTQRHGITDWLIPSVWPETFSFTVREALATGLPTFAFDLGAQGEAVRAAPNGRPLPYALAADPAAVLAAIGDQSWARP